MSDLLPCPFCGGEPERIEIADEGINSGGSCIGCKQCGACSPVHFDRKENLDDSWNRRASPPAGWRPIKTAPKDGTRVLLADRQWVGEAEFHPDEDGWWSAGTDPTDYHDGRVNWPTHWQPLPPPPPEAGNG